MVKRYVGDGVPILTERAPADSSGQQAAGA